MTKTYNSASKLSKHTKCVRVSLTLFQSTCLGDKPTVGGEEQAHLTAPKHGAHTTAALFASVPAVAEVAKTFGDSPCRPKLLASFATGIFSFAVRLTWAFLRKTMK